MKHGDKAKAKSAKAIKASAKKSSSKSGKGGEAKAAKSGKAEAKTKGGSAKAETKAETKASSKPSGDNGKGSKRAVPETAEFSNPVVAAAFKRAVKKYPNAFRRLTD